MNKNESIVRRLFAAISSGDEAEFRSVLAKNCKVYGHGQLESEDVDGYWESVAYLRNAFPDFDVTVEDVLTDGDRTSARVTARGTHRGDFQEIPATNRRVEFASIAQHKLTEGRIAEEHYVADFAGLMAQLTEG